MRRYTRLSAGLLVAVAATGVLGSRLVPRAQAAAALVKTAPGHILVTGGGMALYVFAKDKNGVSACTGKCATFWPPLLAPAGPKVPAHLSGVAGTFGTTRRAGGKTQVTYDGAPLYTFAADKKPGDLNGEGVAGIWWAVAVPAM